MQALRFGPWPDPGFRLLGSALSGAHAIHMLESFVSDIRRTVLANMEKGSPER